MTNKRLSQIRWFEDNGKIRLLKLANQEDFQCPLEDFQEIVKPYLVDNFEDLCKV